MSLRNKTATGYLKDALAAIASPFSWIKNKPHAVDADGTDCYCLIGAFGKAQGLPEEEIVQENAPQLVDFPGVEYVKQALARRLDISPSDVTVSHIYGFNDNNSHEEVTALLEESIELSRQSGGSIPSYATLGAYA